MKEDEALLAMRNQAPMSSSAIMKYDKEKLYLALKQLDDEAKKSPFEAIIQALNSCHSRATANEEGGKVGSFPLSISALDALQEDCDTLEAKFFSLLEQLPLFDTKDVLEVYKDLIETVVNHEYAVGPSIMATQFESAPGWGSLGCSNFFQHDYVKDIQEVLQSEGKLPLRNETCFGDINDALKKTEDLLSQACHLREVQPEELFENSQILKPMAISHRKGNKRKKENKTPLSSATATSSSGSPDVTQGSINVISSETIVVKSHRPHVKQLKTEASASETMIDEAPDPTLGGNAITSAVTENADTSDLDQIKAQEKKPSGSMSPTLPTDLLRCLLAELAMSGIPVHAAEQHLARLQRPVPVLPTQMISLSNSATGSSSPRKGQSEGTVVVELGHIEVDTKGEGEGGDKLNNKPVASAPAISSCGTEGSNLPMDYQSLGAYMEKQLQTPVDPAAVGLLTEYMRKVREGLEVFDASWGKAYSMAAGRHLQQWVGKTALRAGIRGVSPVTSMLQVPPRAELITNPFGSCSVTVAGSRIGEMNGGGARGKKKKWDAHLSSGSLRITSFEEKKLVVGNEKEGGMMHEEWEWLTTLPGYANSVEKINRGQVVVPEGGDDCAHPFIHPSSMLYRQASLQQCLTPMLMHTLTTAPVATVTSNKELDNGQSAPHQVQTVRPAILSSNMKHVDLPFLLQNSPRGTPTNPHCLQDTHLFRALTPLSNFASDGSSDINTDAAFILRREKLFGKHITSLQQQKKQRERGTGRVGTEGSYFQYTVDRALQLLGRGLHALVVDSTTRLANDLEAEKSCQILVPSSVHAASPLPSLSSTSRNEVRVPDTFHRAQLLFSIMQGCLGTGTSNDRSGNSDLPGLSHGYRHGPVVIVCRVQELMDFQDMLQRECDATLGSDRVLRLLPYYGDSADREILRSYMLPEHLYTPHSHCHIVLTHYEAFLQDLFYFKGIQWNLMVVDMFWGVLSNKAYRRVKQEITAVACRHRVISCPSLGRQKAPAELALPSQGKKVPVATASASIMTMLPDLPNTLSFLLPTVFTLLESQEQPYGKIIDGEFVMTVQNRRLWLQALASLTVVHDATVASLVSEDVLSLTECSLSPWQRDAITVHREVRQWMPWYVWEGISVSMSESLTDSGGMKAEEKSAEQLLQYSFDYTAKYTRFYVDPELDAELKSVRLESVGCPDSTLRKRVRKKPGPKGGPSAFPSRNPRGGGGGGGGNVKVQGCEGESVSSTPPAFMGEGILGLGVVKGKRAYNMTKRRAIQQGLLPANFPQEVTDGTASGRGAGGIKKGRGQGGGRGGGGKRKRESCSVGDVQELISAVDTREEEQMQTDGDITSIDETVTSSQTYVRHMKVNGLHEEVLTTKEKESMESCDDLGAGDAEDMMEVEKLEKLEEQSIVSEESTVNDKKQEGGKIFPLVVVTEQRGEEVIVTEYEKAGQNEREEAVFSAMYEAPLSGVKEVDAMKEEKEKEEVTVSHSPSITIIETEPDTVQSNEGPHAKKFKKATYYQRCKEAKYHKDIDSGVIPPNLLKKQGKMSFDLDGNYVPLKLKVVAVKKYSALEERDRSLYCRGNRVQVVISFPGRQRFLGSFKTLREAERAYNCALTQRSTLYEEGTSGLTRLRLVGGGGADKNHQTLILQQACFTKNTKNKDDKIGDSLHYDRVKKSKGVSGDAFSSFNGSSSSSSDDISPKDSSVLSSFEGDPDLVRRVHDEVLIHAVRDMLHPLLAVKAPLGQWETDLTPVQVHHAPPAFAKLKGPGGFVAYVHTRQSCLLGKYLPPTLKLARKFGISDPLGIGHSLSSTRHDCIEGGGSRNQTCVDIHLGDDPSIARLHADIRFNERTQFFEICALHTTASVYVEGVQVHPLLSPASRTLDNVASGYVKIPHQGVIQLGCRIFNFLYPIDSVHVLSAAGVKKKQRRYRKDRHRIQPHPLAYKKGLLEVLISTLALRRKGFSVEGYATPTAMAHYVKYPLNKEDQEAIQAAFDRNGMAMDAALPSVEWTKKQMPLKEGVQEEPTSDLDDYDEEDNEVEVEEEEEEEDEDRKQEEFSQKQKRREELKKLRDQRMEKIENLMRKREENEKTKAERRERLEKEEKERKQLMDEKKRTEVMKKSQEVDDARRLKRGQDAEEKRNDDKKRSPEVETQRDGEEDTTGGGKKPKLVAEISSFVPVDDVIKKENEEKENEEGCHSSPFSFCGDDGAKEGQGSQLLPFDCSRE